MLHLKTDDELRFFVENPAYYQAELVVAARQELRRRHPAAAAPPAAPAPAPLAAPNAAPKNDPPEAVYYAIPEVAPRAAPWVLPTVSVAAVLLVAGLGFWQKGSQPRPARAAAAVAQPPTAAVAPTPLRLETVDAPPPLPTFAVESYVEQALTKLPETEKANEQPLSQYQVISRLFWTAQLPSALLIAQAQQGQPNPVFQNQARLVLGWWHDFDRTLVYRYHFGPVMSDHFNRMQAIAKQQRAALTALATAAAINQPLRLTDTQLVAGQRALPQLLAPLQPAPIKPSL